MTTNSKDLKELSTNDDPHGLDAHKLTAAEIAKNRRSVDRNMKALSTAMENEDLTAQQTPNGRVRQVLKIYRNIKPLLTLLGNLAVVPGNWRGSIIIFTQALDGLELAGNAFKAGKDI